MSPLTIDQARAAFEIVMPVVDLNGDGPGFETLCPVDRRVLNVRLGEAGEIVYECEAGCDRSRIADELHCLSTSPGGFAPPPTVETDWLEGSPMDPAAERPEPLPTVPGFSFLHRAASALIVGPTGGGRSSLVEACAYDAARQGVRVAYLGSEVTESEFNARAADIAARRGDTIGDELRRRLAQVRYLDLASVIPHAWNHADEWASEMPARFDVTIIDPTSAVASALGVDFDKSNADYALFHDRLIQPLVTAGMTVVQLDNVGHAVEAKGRAKGASAKQDRADLTFSCKLKAAPVGLILTAGKVRSSRSPHRRGDSWTFDRDSQRIDRHTGEALDGEPTFRPTLLMERMSRAIQAEPGLTRTALRNAVQGKHEFKALALDLLIAEGYVEQRDEGPAPTHFSTRPFLAPAEGTVPAGSPGSYAVPGPSPDPVSGPGSPVPTHKDGGPGTDPDQQRLDELAARYPEAA